MPRRFRFRLAASAAALAVACRAPEPAVEPPLVVPSIIAALGHRAGALLDGAADASLEHIDADPAHAVKSSWRIFYLERDPAPLLEPLAAHARLFASTRGGDPIGSTTALAAGATVAFDERAVELENRIRAKEFGRFTLLGEFPSALPLNVTGFAELAARLGPTRLEVAAARVGEGELALALALQSNPPEPLRDPRESPEEARAVRTPVARDLRRETVVLERRVLADAGPVAIVVPSPFEGGDGAAFAISVSFERAPSVDPDRTAHAERLARTLDDCRRAAANERTRGAPVVTAEARRRELASALASLAVSSQRRASLCFLADTTRAELAGDLALAAEDATLERYLRSLPSSSDEIERLAADGTTLGFLLERSAYVFLSERWSEAPLAPELAGALVRRAGEVGRSAGAIDDLVAASRDLPSLDAQLVEQNRNALEDSSIAVRVRAFDWLASRGAAPEGFDPFASARERAAALERAEAKASATKGDR